MPKNKLWTQEEINELHRLKALGLPLSEIAVKLGRSSKSLEHKLYGKPIRRVGNTSKFGIRFQQAITV